ncbi:unnamed protein product [Lepidochelys kempii]
MVQKRNFYKGDKINHLLTLYVFLPFAESTENSARTLKCQHKAGSQPRRVPWRDVKVANEAAEGSSSCRTCGCTPAALLTPREPDSTSAVSSRHPLGRRVMQRNWCGLVASAQAGP